MKNWRRDLVRVPTPSWKLALLVAAGLFVTGLSIQFIRKTLELRTLRGQTWNIGFHQTEPFISKGVDGNPVGFGKDVLTEAARRAGVQLRWVFVPQGAAAAFEDGIIDLFPRSSDVAGMARAPHITAPWFETFYGIVQPAGGNITPETLAGRRVATTSSHFLRAYAHRVLPGAVVVQHSSANQALASVCAGRTDAAFAELREATSMLMARIPECLHSPLRAVPLRQAVVVAGIGSTGRAAPIADLLREQISAMAAEGQLTELHAHWFLAPLNEVSSVEKVLLIRGQQRLLVAFSAVLLLLLGLTVAVLWRMRQLRTAAVRASEAKSMFVATMSHEIRTPMNGVIGMANLLRETPLSAEQQGMLNTITQSSESLLSIINDILDLSKLDALRMRLIHADYSPAEVVRAVGALILPAAMEKGLAVAVSIHPSVPPLSRGDSLRLRQVLLHLGGNAVKFTLTGQVSLQVDLSTEAKLRFTVSDTGIGIPLDVQAGLFTPFTQADASTSRLYEGTGLGLAISKRLVSLMNGSIGVESSPGKGSCFWFEIPFVPPLDASAARAVNPSVAQPAAASLRVLLAEDNPVNQVVATRLLQKRGHTVTLASNGALAVEAYRTGEWDLILMDCQMPDVDGYDATRRIRALERSTGKRTRIVALTAHAMAEDRNKCLEAGMDDYITKPLDVAQLERILSTPAITPAGRASAHRASAST